MFNTHLAHSYIILRILNVIKHLCFQAFVTRLHLKLIFVRKLGTFSAAGSTATATATATAADAHVRRFHVFREISSECLLIWYYVD
jgi:hypothetical protein